MGGTREATKIAFSVLLFGPVSIISINIDTRGLVIWNMGISAYQQHCFSLQCLLHLTVN